MSFKLNEKQEIIKYISTRRADPKFRAVENEQNLARIHKKRASPEFREAERKKRRYSRTKGRNPEPTAAGNVQKPVYKQGQDSDRKYCNIERQRGFGHKRTADGDANIQQPESNAKQTRSETTIYNYLHNEFVTENDTVEASDKSLKNQISANQDNLEHCICRFLASVAKGPIFVCTCCHQTWFSHSVVVVTSKLSVSNELKGKCFTNKLSENAQLP